MPDPTSLVRSRRNRRLDQRRVRETRLGMGGVGIGILFSLLLALLILAAALAYADLTRDLPNAALLPALLNPPDGLLLQPTRVYDRSGQHLLMTFAPGEGDASRRYIPLNSQSPQHLPDWLAKATVAIVDPNFWSHGGYLLSGWNDSEAHPTLAQQLVSDLLLYNEPPSPRRALRERLLAAQITSEYGRGQVLEWVLNSADYGNYAFGAEAAAQLYFGKSATELTLAESALLAATSQAPSLNLLGARDLAIQRRDKTVQLMARLRLISRKQAAEALAEAVPVAASLRNGADSRAPAFLNLVIHQLDGQFTRERIEHGGVRIITTMDYDLQQQAACTTLDFAARLTGAADPSASAPCSAARALPLLPPDTTFAEPSLSALVYDPGSGQVLAAVGETLRGVETEFLLAHDPGSLMTPFVYLTAFTRGLSPASLVWDIPPAGEASTGGSPGALFHGPVRMRLALANDYAVPAQTVEAQMGSDAIDRIESSFGLSAGKKTLLDMASAYGIFAAQGVRHGVPGPTMVLRVEGLDHSVWIDLTSPQAQPVVAAPLAYIVNNVLSDETARRPSLGDPNALEIGRPAGVKIGQTQARLDSWTVGYTPSRLVAAWVGTHAAQSPNLSLPLSAALWSALIRVATQSMSAEAWIAPAGVTSMDVCDPSGLLPTRNCQSVVKEVFLNGNEPVQADALYRTFQVNRETGLLATVFTAPQLIEDRIYMVVPPEAQSWAKAANIAIAPSDYDAIQAPHINPDVRITAPAMLADVSGLVQISGTASGEAFDHYRVLVGQGLNPQQWIVVGNDATGRVEDGLLATWDTTGLSGLYAVELQVIHTDQRIETAITQVTVNGK